MIHLARLFPADTIIDIQYHEHYAAVAELIQTALPEASEDLHFHVLEEIRAKSNSKEVNLGNGFALCHTRLGEASLSNVTGSIGLFGRKLPFLTGEPVHTVLCILIPVSHGQTYLTLVSRLSRFLLQPGISELFLRREHQEIISALQDFDSE